MSSTLDKMRLTDKKMDSNEENSAATKATELFTGNPESLGRCTNGIVLLLQLWT
jgi:hypothetical protein